MQDISADDALLKWRVANSNKTRLDGVLSNLTSRLDKLDTDIKDWSDAKIILEQLKNYKLEKRKDFILTIINSALKDIFEADYILDIQPREMKGKSISSTQKYDIIFFQNGIEIARNDELLTSNGGGVLSIASLFFKILIGYLYSKNKFYIFDESLSQVSPQYRERLSLFLQKFCTKYGFTIVVVSQTEELEGHADLVYQLNSSVDSNNLPVLEIEEIRGEQPTEDFFYSRIKNFQSVVDQSFIYKGFTIIRGPNNSGKSATLRAIEAILFNNFKTDTYPRKHPTSKITTEITFGYQAKIDQAPKEIGLKYKSSKVMFIIDGEEYYGKSLAADKLKEAVEEIGFKYIDVKKMYKNFKGALKDQTERIAYTNQYDGLFLIGSKTSDSEKIFSFLFNTENIALAIAQAKETILEMAKEHKDIQKDIISVNEEITVATRNVEYYINIYYYQMINEFQDTILRENILKKDTQRLTDINNGIHNFIVSTEYLLWLEENIGFLNELRNKNEYNTRQMELVTNVISEFDKANLIYSFIELENTIQSHSSEMVRYDNLIPSMQGVIMLSYWDDLNSYRDASILTKARLDDSIENLGREFNLCECHECSGLGVVPS